MTEESKVAQKEEILKNEDSIDEMLKTHTSASEINVDQNLFD